MTAAHHSHEEGSTVAVEVVTTPSGAEHRRIPAGPLLLPRQLRQLQVVASDGIPDDEGVIDGPALPVPISKEDAAVAGVEHEPAAAVRERLAEAEGGRRDEAGSAAVA